MVTRTRAGYRRKPVSGSMSSIFRSGSEIGSRNRLGSRLGSPRSPLMKAPEGPLRIRVRRSEDGAPGLLGTSGGPVRVNLGARVCHTGFGRTNNLGTRRHRGQPMLRTAPRRQPLPLQVPRPLNSKSWHGEHPSANNFLSTASNLNCDCNIDI